IKRVMSISARLLFNWVLIGQFDHIYHLRIGGGALTITGEHVIYFTTAGLVLAAMLHLALNVRELRPDHPPIGGRFRPREFLGDIFSSRQFLLIYLLLFCNVALMAGLGQLTPLLITEQFGYSKGTMGSLQAATILVDLCVVIPVAALLADRFDRFRTFQVGLVLSTLHPIAYWLFVNYVAANHVPTPAQIVGFNLYHTMVDAVAALALEPYFFDLAPRAKMGAMNSGFLFMKGTLTVIVANAVGLWVKYFTRYVSKTDHPDYMSGYLCIFVVGILGCLATLYFAHQRQTGKVIEYGKIDEQTVADAAMSDSLEEPGVIPTPVG
ncbi:MAG: MFS transporter, partial [Tepidisphaeraceae bacterium]